LIKKEFDKISGVIHSEAGQEVRFQTATQLANIILEINKNDDEVEEIIITGHTEEGNAHFKFWADPNRPNWGCIQVDENKINALLSHKLDQIKKITDSY